MSEKITKKKSLGQNFLKSEAVLKTIVDASDLWEDNLVLEIGPGDGALTKHLLEFATKVVAIEKDHRLIPILQKKFKEQIEQHRLDLIEKDILDFDPKTLEFYGLNYKIIANIPYYITGQVIRKFLEAEKKPESMTLLVQKEVGERIVAKDNKESLLSISVKIFGTPKYIRTVKKGSFTPAPKVDSAIISIRDIKKPGIDEKKFFEVLKKGFAHKRKLLTSNLGIEPEVLEKIGISTKARAENLSLGDWVHLSKI